MSRKIQILTLVLIMSMFIIIIPGCNTDTSISASKYYYNQLTELEQGIYRNLEIHKNEFIEGKKVEIIRADSSEEINRIFNSGSYKKAYEAYIMDIPMSTLWCNLTYQSLTTECIEVIQENKKEYQYVVYLVPDEGKEISSAFDTSEELQSAINAIEQTAQDFINTLEGTNHEKIRAIHDWMLEGAVYGTNKNSQDIYSSIVEKESICYGFALGFKYLCDISGINAIVVIGEDHVWNYVQDDDGRWYLVDVTWDLDLGLKYFLTEIETEMTSGKREYNDFFGFSYEFFHKQ